ncbi:UvrD-helicase domain-containing protein, partial [Balneolaceae bacterium ANBcel3]|nr:UvrD-helicase domain-containing protein [Balneolaceae bacterium ANBcel3]
MDESSLFEMANGTPAGYIEKLKKARNLWEKELETRVTPVLNAFEAHPEWFKKPEKRPKNTRELFEGEVVTKNKKLSKRIIPDKNIDSMVREDLDALLAEAGRYYEGLKALSSFLDDPEVEQTLNNNTGEQVFDANSEAYWNMKDLAGLSLRWLYLMRFCRIREGFFNYDDMIWLTHRLLTEHPEVIAQIRSRFDQIMVDEFQDTDRRQWDIIRMLASQDSESSSKESGRQVFIVGDVKQAIYRFRGGDVALMKEVEADLRDHNDSEWLLRVPLLYSFRSNDAVLSFTNSLFRSVFPSEKEASSFEAWHQPLEPPPEGLSKNARADGEVRIFSANYKDLSEEVDKKDGDSVAARNLLENIHLLEARRIAAFLLSVKKGEVPQYERITELMQEEKPAVGILYKRRSYIHAMEQALTEAGLTYTVAKGVSFFSKREVLDAWLLVSFLLDAFDDLSLAGVLRSPMVGISDSALLGIRMAMDQNPYEYTHFWMALEHQDTWAKNLLNDDDRFVLKHGLQFLKELREGIPVFRVSELLEKAFFTDGPWFGGFANDLQARENLVKLLDMIRDFESSGKGTLFEIHRFLSDRIDQEAKEADAEHPDPASVQLMTIHGSKGLQFPMVVIPDMYAGGQNAHLFLAASDQESQLQPAVSYKAADKDSDEDAGSSFLHMLLKDEQGQREIAELKRLFYVAVTRAETHLLLSKVRPKKASSSGTMASYVDKWLEENEGREHICWKSEEQSSGEAESKRTSMVLETLDADGLEELASPGYLNAPARTVKDNEIPVEKILLSRESPSFAKAYGNISEGVKTASSLEDKEGSERDSEGEDFLRDKETSAEMATFKGIHAADVGTLIHRTLEKGIGLGLWSGSSGDSTVGQQELFTQAAKSGEEGAAHGMEEVVRFWQRELLGMGYKNAPDLIEEHRDEWWRHCRNAVEWLNVKFGNRAGKRFET